MVLLAQLSDVHLGPLPTVSVADLASKRLLGYLNWQRNRARVHGDAVLTALTADMHAARPDQIVVTGDLVNLGLPSEYRTARIWLESLGSPHDVTVIPGNHDAYVASGVAHFTEQWHDFASGDGEAHDGATFPFLRRRGPLALIGLSSAVPTAPFMATGRVGAAQAAALEMLLKTAEREGLFRIVLIHHPVAENSATRMRRLVDAERVREVILARGAELVLHGHNHKTSLLSVPGPLGAVPVIGATATSLRPRPHHAGGGYNLLSIEGEPGAWRLTLRERAVTESGAVATRLERVLAIPGSG